MLSINRPDFQVIDHGSIYILRAQTPEADLWVEDNLPDDFQGVVEHRYINDILDGFSNEGLTFE